MQKLPAVIPTVGSYDLKSGRHLSDLTSWVNTVHDAKQVNNFHETKK